MTDPEALRRIVAEGRALYERWAETGQFDRADWVDWIDEYLPHMLSALEERSLSPPQWQPIETVPKDRYVLLFGSDCPRWDGNMEVGRWFEADGVDGCFWSCGGPNGGLELNGSGSPGHYDRFTHWMELPPDAAPPSEPKP